MLEVTHLMKNYTFAIHSEVYVFMPLREKLLPSRSFLFLKFYSLFHWHYFNLLNIVLRYLFGLRFDRTLVTVKS
jgi:hypothetical protein